jgi:hypothetical protein
MKQLIENFNKFVNEEEKQTLNENPAAMLAGAGLLVALGTRGGRSLIAKVLRMPGELMDTITKLPFEGGKIVGVEMPKLEQMVEFANQLQPNRVPLDKLADLIEGLTDEEGDALNAALEPVKMGTPVGRIAKGTEMMS